MKRIATLSTLMLALSAVSAWSQASTTINWSNFSFDPTTQNSLLFRDAAGTPLSQGAAATNTDGMLVQLGYYSAATTANNFAGTWVPLTGFGPTLHTSIGDSAGNPTAGGSGNGVIDFNTFFGGLFLNTTNVRVYDTGDTGTYVTQSSIPITTAPPPPNNQVLSIRFYDSASGTTGSYNTVSSDDWLYKTPDVSTPVVTLNLESAFLASTLEFESSGPLANFRTVILIPEPSTYALIGLGAVGLMVAYRRRAKVVA